MAERAKQSECQSQSDQEFGVSGEHKDDPRSTIRKRANSYQLFIELCRPGPMIAPTVR
jgi:hypothetical protein